MSSLVLVVIAGILAASQAVLNASPTGAVLGGPPSSMAGSTTLAAVGPTAIPGSAAGSDNLAAPVANAGSNGSAKAR